MEKRRRVESHLRQWRHNRQFAATIDPAYRDWQVNVIFYTALHLIDAALANLDVIVSDHGERNNHVRTNESFAAIRGKYMNLYRISRVTRYDPDPDAWLPAEYLTIEDLLNDLLKPIENGVGPLTGGSIRFQPLPLKT